VFHGVIGPVPASPRLRSEVREIVHALTEAFALRGVCSLDFLFDDQRLLVLEVNPRPPASLVLYPLSSGQPIWHAHVRACRDGLLPDSNSANAAHEAVVRGSEIVFARRPCVFGSAATSALGRDAAIHDVPRRGARFAPGDPVCSVSASGGDAETVAIELQRRVEAVYATLEELS